ncbi:hypothetical protein EBL_c10680 [Shimwellia blattae DSM 4481 = NBRC 105725]|uniref:Uncharacterized protein n=1 Tax=Shimwellia blattae (strain ATCC 29907 / DSM 4481 / JCM 1650 / NBRC 105725 / CDC 9005-74) TaxID=630626 RepID=I2B6M4_SHIBC|nr:hypothetical protein EBL_c10680 [Shimwellia blattae DSM 4481 = NBRC 105725]
MKCHSYADSAARRGGKNLILYCDNSLHCVADYYHLW